jgi:hypothetical protein
VAEYEIIYEKKKDAQHSAKKLRKQADTKNVRVVVVPKYLVTARGEFLEDYEWPFNTKREAEKFANKIKRPGPREQKFDVKIKKINWWAVRWDEKRSKNPDDIRVQLVEDDQGNPIVQAASKADEKRMRAKLKSLEGDDVVVLVEGDETKKTAKFMAVKSDPVLASAVYGGLGSVAGAIPGVLLASPVAVWLGWATGGALGARAGAASVRKDKATWGGGIGGALGGPLGAALGGALGARKKNPSTKALKNKLLK